MAKTETIQTNQTMPPPEAAGMTLPEAARQATEHGLMMRRKSDPAGYCCVLPTDTPKGCLVIRDASDSGAMFRWQPTLSDLLADDWELTGRTDGLLLGKRGVEARKT